MIDMDDIQRNLQEWLRNPFWAEYYRSAPSARCREFIALEFWYSEGSWRGRLRRGRNEEGR